MINKKNYTAELLRAFKESDKSHVTIDDLSARGIKVYFKDDKHDGRLDLDFYIHLQTLVEEKLLVSPDLQPFKTMEDIGVMCDHFGDPYDIELNSKMLRLKTKGQERLEELVKNEIWKNLIDEIKKSPAKALSTGVAELIKLVIKGVV